jgi:ribulose-5-phosphate 4-epimerase/fuculose-1-phosphate aldolase
MITEAHSPWAARVAEPSEKRRILALIESDEARDQQRKLANAFRVLAHVGMVCGLYEGLYGHISVRVPGAPDHFWVNPIGVPFAHMTSADLVLISATGELIAGSSMHNFAAFLIHSSIHRARPDINCVVHHHPRATCAFSALGMELLPIDQVGCSFFEDHAVHAEYTGIVAEQDQAASIVRALGQRRALILTNHGALTCAASIEQATIDMYELERTCDVQLRALATGKPLQLIPEEAARQVREIRTAPRRYRAEWMLLMRILEVQAPTAT